MKIGIVVVMLIVGALAVSRQAAAQTGILRTRPSATEVLNPLAPFTLGSGFEFERDDEHDQYNAPLVLEYNPAPRFKLTFESALTHITNKGEETFTATGLDDLETSVEYEFVRERRYRPALTMIGLVKWPTTTSSDIGSPGNDYAVGLDASKEFVNFELDFNVLYTVTGDPEGEDGAEISLAASYPLNYQLDLLAELLTATDSGDTDLTLGCAWQPTPFLSLEQGVLVRSGGGWEALFAVSYAFGGD
jgi:hypothetical protein